MRTMPSASPVRGQDCPYHLVRHRLLSRMLLPVRARGIQAGGLSGSQDAPHGGYQRANEEYGDGGEIPELPESCLHEAQRTPKIPKTHVTNGRKPRGDCVEDTAGSSQFFRRTEQHRQTTMPVHRNPPPFFHRLIALLHCAFLVFAAAPLLAQDQVDLGDKVARGSGAVNKITFHIRVVKTVTEQSIVRVPWRHGGRLCISRRGARGKGECRFHRAAQRPQRTRTRTARRVGEIVPRPRADAEALRRDRALGGYGEFPSTGLGGASSYGLRHCLAGLWPKADRRGRRRSTRASLAPRHDLPSLRLQRRIDLRLQLAERLCKFRRGEVVAFV